jgi:hypothetical protein
MRCFGGMNSIPERVLIRFLALKRRSVGNGAGLIHAVEVEIFGIHDRPIEEQEDVAPHDLYSCMQRLWSRRDGERRAEVRCNPVAAVRPNSPDTVIASANPNL